MGYNDVMACGVVAYGDIVAQRSGTYRKSLCTEAVVLAYGRGVWTWRKDVASNENQNGSEGPKVALTSTLPAKKTNSPDGRVCRPDGMEKRRKRKKRKRRRKRGRRKRKKRRKNEEQIKPKKGEVV